MYIDPGFGGMLIQVLLAIVAAGGVLLFSIRRKLRTLFSKKKGNDTSGVAPDIDGAKADMSPTEESDDDDAIDMLSDD